MKYENLELATTIGKSIKEAEEKLKQLDGNPVSIDIIEAGKHGGFILDFNTGADGLLNGIASEFVQQLVSYYEGRIKDFKSQLEKL